jgi:ABC-2 type transport system permease protein
MMRAYTAQFTSTVKEDLQYFFSDSFLASIGTLQHAALIILVYAATSRSLYFGIFTWSMLVWYLILAQIIQGMGKNLIREVNADIQQGNIVNALTKPYSYPLSQFSTFFASTIIESASAFILCIPLGLVLAGNIFTPISIIMGILLVIFAITINFLITLSIGLIAFWTEDATPYSWIYGKLMFILGGLYFPLEVFPAWFESIAKLLPPAFIVYYPARVIVAFNWHDFWYVLGMQAAYIAVLAPIAWLVYRAAIKKVNINGG